MNELKKIAEDGRAFARSVKSVTQLFDVLEKIGSIEQLEQETLSRLDKAKAAIAEAEAAVTAERKKADGLTAANADLYQRNAALVKSISGNEAEITTATARLAEVRADIDKETAALDGLRARIRDAKAALQ